MRRTALLACALLVGAPCRGPASDDFTEVATLATPSCVSAVTFAPDGRVIAAVDADFAVRVWDLTTGLLRTSFRCGDERASHLAYSPDGLTLAVGTLDGNVWLWDMRSGQRRATPAAFGPGMTALQYSPDGKLLAIGHDCVGVHVRDTATWKIVASLEGLPENPLQLSGPRNCVTRLAFAPDGASLAAVCWLGPLKVWDLATRRPRGPDKAGLGAVAFAPDGKALATGNGIALTVRDARTLEITRALEWHRAFYVQALAYSPDGGTLLAVVGDGEFRRWDLATGAEGPPLEGLPERTYTMALGAPGPMLAAAGYANGAYVLKVWRLKGPVAVPGPVRPAPAR